MPEYEEPTAERIEVRNTFPTPVVMVMLPDHEKLNTRLRKTIMAREKKEPASDQYDSNIGGWHSQRDFPKWGGKAGEQIIETALSVADRMTASRSGRPIDVDWAPLPPRVRAAAGAT